MTHSINLTPKIKKIIRIKYLDGESLASIANTYGTYVERIKKILIEQNVELRSAYRRIGDSLDASTFDIEILSQKVSFDFTP